MPKISWQKEWKKLKKSWKKLDFFKSWQKGIKKLANSWQIDSKQLAISWQKVEKNKRKNKKNWDARTHRQTDRQIPKTNGHPLHEFQVQGAGLDR